VSLPAESFSESKYNDSDRLVADEQANQSSHKHSSPSRRILLVHGTVLFARFDLFKRIFKTWGIPTWISPRSTFCAKLRESCRDVKLERLRWSGGNSPKCRHEAALRLAQKINRSASFHPDEKLFIIAHSHGGNVALEAVKHCDQSLIAGIACLGTPFFRFRTRDVERAFFPITYVFVAILLALSALVGCLLGVFVEEFLAAVSLIGFGLVLYFRESLKVPWVNRLQTRLEGIAAKNAHVFSMSLKLLCIESRRKEARWALKVARLLGSLPLTVARVVTVLWLGIQFLGALLVVFELMLTGGNGLLYVSWGETVGRIGGAIIVVYFIYLFGLAIVTPFAWLLSRFMAWLSWGGTPPSIWIDTDVDFRPHDQMGDFEVHKIRSHRFLALEHCLLYEQAEIVSAIVEWVEGRRPEPLFFTPQRQYFP